MNKIINYLIIFGVSLSSFTQLRIGSVGPSEMLLLMAIVLIFIVNKGRFSIHLNIYNIFWVVFLFSLIVFTSIAVLKGENLEISNVREFISYLFIFLMVLSFWNHFSDLDLNNILEQINKIYWISSILLIMLFWYSTMTTSIFSYELYFGDRLTLLSENPHQLSFYIGPLIIVGFSYFKSKILSLKNIFIILNTLILLSIGISTLSTTFYVAFALAFIFLLTFYVLNIFKRNKINSYLSYSILFFISLTFFYFIMFRFQLIFMIFENDENGLGRIYLWIQAIMYAIQNYFFGYGLGTVIPVDSHLFDTSEAHNLFLDVLLKGGIVPMIILIILFLISFVRFIPYKLYNSILIFMFIYSMAGFSLKRVIFWFLLIIMTIIVQKNKKEKYK